MMKRTLLPATLLLALLGGACADAVTSSPDITASGDALRSSGGDSESMLLASSYSGAQQPGWKTVATLPDSAWVVIDVIGQVYHSRNPDCDVLPPAWQPVNYPWDRLYAGPMFGASQVAVRPIPGGGSYRLWPVNGDTETATHARVLVYSRQPGMKVEVGRVSVMSLCGNPTAGEWSPMYKLAGGQQVTVTKIGSPLIFDAPDVVAPNQKATFAVEPHGSLRLLNPPGLNGKPGRLTWWYAPGDTLPEAVHAATGYMYVIPGCQDEKVCEHAPEKSGRLVVNGYVEGTSVFRKSHVIRVDSARMELSCPASVTRGENMTCSVAAVPSGTLDSIRWEFTDSVGHRIPGPEGVAAWSGKMVVGGRITVSAVLNGSPETRDTVITVRPRNWPRPTVTPREELATDLPPPEDVAAPHHLGDSHVDSIPSPNLTTFKIADGPNTGWWYIPDPIQTIRVIVHINEAAFQSGSAWHELQIGGAWTDPTTGITHQNGYCTQAQVPTLRRLTREHEGSLSSPLTSHVDAMRRYIRENEPQDSMEAVVAWDADTKTFSFTQVVRSWYRAYIRNNLTGYSSPHKPAGVVDLAPFPCVARPWH